MDLHHEDEARHRIYLEAQMTTVPEMIHQEQEAHLIGNTPYKSTYKLNPGSPL